jgi:hypothetical protein
MVIVFADEILVSMKLLNTMVITFACGTGVGFVTRIIR